MFGRKKRATVGDVDGMMAEGTVVVDVRSPREWAAGHVPQSIHSPLGTALPADLDPTVPVLVVCRSGNRSRVAVRQLARAGYEATDLKGGLRAWVRAGRSLVDARGRPGAVV